ncbi:ribosomal protein L10 family protein [Cavenderia fasciculata]|uniref:Ribosome assembly factor mrt4 n=1 Tax=Cavenderia fasciculata TaxID=261658 RepID=F4PVJ6_CACFS|nr:ribosomal protein L10 family protein [Cavenderia fasciculata]EGG20010.1 ribosomal protein L10 family protein [Cavenderia fasciculata]|eukprot:XP_004366993.1 ribosomal protein L10 family protein [Cavenderia fasciculata]
MARSKRSKVVSLTTVVKNPGEKKKRLVANVRELIDEYKSIYVVSFDNARNSHLKQARTDWPASKFLYGKKQVLAVGLGRTLEEELRPNLSKVTKYLSGECALFFTNDSKDTVMTYFENFKEEDHARAGFVPKETVVIPAGTIDMLHSQEPYLRKLGMPTLLKAGIISLESDFNLCEEGIPVTPDQAKLMQLFDKKISEFSFRVVGVWSDDAFEAFAEPSQDGDMEDDE